MPDARREAKKRFPPLAPRPFAMDLSSLLPLLETTTEFEALSARLRAGEPQAEPVEAMEAARPFVLAALARALARPLLVVTARADRARQLLTELQAWSGTPEQIFYFAEPEPLLYERLPWSPETIAARLAALSAFSQDEHAPAIVVTTVRALMPHTLRPEEFRASTRTLRRGEALSPERMLGQWVELGYESEPVVEAPGTFSRRGGIVDIWVPSEPLPVRIEFLGDEVESLRRFDPATQRSREVVAALTISPASEASLARAPETAARVRALDFSKTHPVAASTFRQDIEALEQKRRFRGVEFYLPYFNPQPASLVEYLPAGGLIAVEDWQELEAAAQQFGMQAESVREDLESRGEAPTGLRRPYFTWEELRNQLLGHPRLLFDYQSPGDTPALPFAPGPRFGGQVRKVVDEIMRLRAEQARIVVVSRQSERLSDLLRERDVFVKPVANLDYVPKPGHVELVQGALSEGFRLRVRRLEGSDQPSNLQLWTPEGFDISTMDETRTAGPGANLELLSDAEIFGWARPKPRRLTSSAPRPQSPEAFFADLAVGDYVVHVDHGIGVFRGLQKMELGGPEREYLLIEYAHGDRLYVPVHQIDRLSRYVAPGGHTPTLHRLGTAEWSQVKERTQRAVADIARELLELYAAREVVSGHAYSEDTPWQHEFEAAFPYVETEDQLAAIDRVKEDMQQGRPMDRLVVGDVGYGKTEVALRASFKAVMDGKQVAVLVPTTVLAQQHYNNFKERLAPFPITVEMLSRFRSDKEQDAIIEKLAAGGIDIVIGTHRLLSKDVQFKDLGLLIIDEEQRFGVSHKERLKQLRQEVDVLTLTATPIPRTLYLSLSGARDMSTIETPPEERQPIRTYVTGYDERLVRDAILRELDRGGQVFFVHNRVRGIGIIAQQLQKLVPEARIGIGHGQMPEDELEAVMAEFAAGKYDVLVCTTIIESGIDIPNANTILINNADKFGLAQLYQLRGRVGRSAARAYAYFLYDKRQELAPEARARLQTIAEASELGVGFQIAMRDLEIRGAGDILGARQSGHIAAVGFDLYCRLLAHAIDEQRGKLEKREQPLGAADGDLLATPLIELPIPAQIPEDYIADASLRLRLYRRLADVTTKPQVDEIAQEFEDRFGPPPEPVKNLFYLLRLKLAARAARVAAIMMEEDRVLVRFREEDTARTARLTTRYAPLVRVARERMWLPGPEADPHWRTRLVGILEAEAKDRTGAPRSVGNGAGSNADGHHSS
jgi:transcription-repair coupling factor (superfamily II helicase)